MNPPSALITPRSLYSRTMRRAIVAMLRGRTRRGLARVMVGGLDHLTPWNRGGDAAGPLLVVANHSSWWDAVLPVLLSLDLLHLDAYGLMDAEQLRRYSFFRHVGLLPVDRENRRGALLSLGPIAESLRSRPRVLWLFPQGRLLPAEVRPLGCEPGAAWLVERLGGCRVLPVAFRYEPCASPRPEAWIRIAEPRWCAAGGGLRSVTAEIERSITAELDALGHDVAAGQTEAYRSVMK